MRLMKLLTDRTRDRFGVNEGAALGANAPESNARLNSAGPRAIPRSPAALVFLAGAGFANLLFPSAGYRDGEPP